MDVSNRIRESRKAAGLTQTALGEVLCVGKANVSSWERGGHQPSYAQLLKISQLTKSPIPLPRGGATAAAQSQRRGLGCGESGGQLAARPTAQHARGHDAE